MFSRDICNPNVILTRSGRIAINEMKEASISMADPLTYLPPFNENNIKTCFLHLEAIFFVRNITSKMSKFSNLVQALYLSIVDDVDHDHEPYSRLKETILKHTDRSDKDLIRQLFNNFTRDNETPSKLLHFMKSRLCKHSGIKPPRPVIRLFIFDSYTDSRSGV